MRLDIEGATIHYESMGTDGPTLVLVHGLGSTPHLWHAQRALEGHCRLLIPTLRGHGRSAKTPPYTVPRFAADLAALVRQLKIESCIVVGSSMGGGVGVQLAVELPDIVRGVVIVSGFAAIPPIGRERMSQRIDVVRKRGKEAIAGTISDPIFGAHTHVSNAALVGMHHLVVCENSEEDLIAQWNGMMEYDITASLALLKVPTMLVFGEQDRMVNIGAQIDLKRRVPHASVRCIAKSGHVPNIENPSEFNAAILEFVVGVMARS